MRNILTLGLALGVPALAGTAGAQQTHEYFLWGGTPATTEWEIRRTADLDPGEIVARVDAQPRTGKECLNRRRLRRLTPPPHND